MSSSTGFWLIPTSHEFQNLSRLENQNLSRLKKIRLFRVCLCLHLLNLQSTEGSSSYHKIVCLGASILLFILIFKNKLDVSKKKSTRSFPPKKKENKLEAASSENLKPQQIRSFKVLMQTIISLEPPHIFNSGLICIFDGNAKYSKPLEFIASLLPITQNLSGDKTRSCYFPSNLLQRLSDPRGAYRLLLGT